VPVLLGSLPPTGVASPAEAVAVPRSYVRVEPDVEVTASLVVARVRPDALALATVQDVPRVVRPGLDAALLLLPFGLQTSFHVGAPHHPATAAVLVCRHLEKQALVDDIVRPSGPQLAPAQLHPWVWNAAVDLWDHGHFSEAVRAASSAIFDRHLPAKVGYESPQGAADLITKAFSLNPPSSSEARLRFTDLAEGTQDWKSAHEGAMNFGRGCAKGIRNVTTHGATPSEQEALEALASLSLLARWIDEADVVTL